MADINVERKGPSIWPWIIGLLVLALLIWAIAEMVDTDEVRDVATVEEVEERPAAVPAPVPATPAAPAEFENLMPTGPEDYGQMVVVEGEVVGTPTPEGIWLLEDNNQVVFVRTPIRTEGGQMVQPGDVAAGQQIDDIVGVVEKVQPERVAAWIDRAELRNLDQFGSWDVHEDLIIVAAPAGAAPGAPGQTTQPGAQQQPGTQQQPGAQQQPAAAPTTGRDTAQPD